MTELELERKVMRARVKALLAFPFFGHLAAGMRHQILSADEAKKMGIEVGATDGESIFYNAASVESLTPQQLVGLIAHEVMHPALGHLWRRGARDNQAWNIACDKVVNHHVTSAGIELPPNGIPGVPDKGAEELYVAPLPGSGGGKGGKGAQGKWDFGAMVDKPGTPQQTPDEAQAQERAWRGKVVGAVQALGRGNMPADIQRLYDELTTSKVDWRARLRDLMGQVTRNDYSWARGNRKYLSRGIYLPALYSPEVGALLVVVDTSGSIGDRELSSAVAEVTAIIAEFPGADVHVWSCDTRVHEVGVFSGADLPIKAKFPGGGGTSFCEPFERLEKMDPKPSATIYITDLDGYFPKTPPDGRVIWVAVGASKRAVEQVPWGEVIELTESEVGR